MTFVEQPACFSSDRFRMRDVLSAFKRLSLPDTTTADLSHELLDSFSQLLIDIDMVVITRLEPRVLIF